MSSLVQVLLEKIDDVIFRLENFEMLKLLSKNRDVQILMENLKQLKETNSATTVEDIQGQKNQIKKQPVRDVYEYNFFFIDSTTLCLHSGEQQFLFFFSF